MIFRLRVLLPALLLSVRPRRVFPWFLPPSASPPLASSRLLFFFFISPESATHQPCKDSAPFLLLRPSRRCPSRELRPGPSGRSLPYRGQYRLLYMRDICFPLFVPLSFLSSPFFELERWTLRFAPPRSLFSFSPQSPRTGEPKFFPPPFDRADPFPLQVSSPHPFGIIFFSSLSNR